MINDGDKFKIIHNGYGSFSVSDCTLENAVQLLNTYLGNLGDHVQEAVKVIQQKKEHYVVSNQIVVQPLKKFWGLNLGKNYQRQRDWCMGVRWKALKSQHLRWTPSIWPK